jgi:GGDEF domain-containing protein
MKRGMASEPPPRARPARPVADAPVAELVNGSQDLARGWLLTLLERSPLSAAASLPAERFAEEAPGLCGAVARAIGSDEALERLRPGGDLHPLAARAGALTGAQSQPEVDAAVEALRAVVWGAALEELRAPAPDLVAALAERIAAVAWTVRSAAVGAAPELADAPLSGGWEAELANAVSESSRTGGRLALLLVDVDGADRIEAYAGPDTAATLLERAAEAVRGALGEDDLMLEEAPGRAWVVAADRGRLAAGVLADRVGRELERAVAVRGVPLTATIGIAVHPVDATDAAGLAACAEQALYAARAAGQPVGGADAERPGRSGPRLVQ